MNWKAFIVASLTRWAPVLAAVMLCGCFQVQDELTLQSDGSGKITLTLHTSLSDDLIDTLKMLRNRGSGAPIYPPTSEEEARRLFPANDFALKIDQQSGDDGTKLLIEATFKDINRLLASPYAYAHQLVLHTNANGTLNLQALSGGTPLAQAAQLKTEGDLAPDELPGIEDAQAKKGQMRFEFRVTLPNPIITANQPHANKSITWIVERAKCKDDTEFAARLAGTLDATCRTDGLSFSAVTPLRLGLLPFNHLTTATLAQEIPTAATNQIQAAAKFVPYLLRLTRTRDLSLPGSPRGGQAELVGGITLPAVWAPYRWGQAKVEEAIDGQGNSLLLRNEGEGALTSNLEALQTTDDVESENETARRADVPGKPHLIALSFKAPGWRTREIAKIKGHLDLEYLGEREVIKLSHAVPAGLVTDVNQPPSPNERPGSERQPIANPRLAELGLFLRASAVTVQGGMTVLELETSGSKVALLDAQLFDAEGVPWPTTLSQPNAPGKNDRSGQLRVVGMPKAPFSLALIAARAGPSATVPILIEHVLAVEQKSESSQPAQSDATAGFLAEPVRLTLSSLHYFPAGESYFKGRPAASLFGPWTTGTVVSAKLFPPNDRVIQSVSGVRVVAAQDDQGRSIPPVTGPGSFAGTSRQSAPPNSDDPEKGGAIGVELRLGLPAADAKAITDLTAEAVVLSIGGWKEMALTNVQANPKKEIDLSEIVPGAKLVINRVGNGRRDRTVEASLEGPPAINQLGMKLKLSGPQSSQSRMWDRRDRHRNSGGKNTRNVIIQSHDPQMSEEARNGPLTLLVRLPQDVKRERVQFKLKPLDLL